MPSLIDYETHYRRGARLFGAPNRQFVRFFAEHAARAERGREKLSVLDLGCGQGRDALMAARFGHQVVGVELSASGIQHMLADARSEGLRIEGIVADLLDFRTRRKFAVVMLDRVLHLLPDEAQRQLAWQRLAALTKPGGHALVAVGAQHRRLLHDGFASCAHDWRVQRRMADFICAQRTG